MTENLLFCGGRRSKALVVRCRSDPIPPNIEGEITSVLPLLSHRIPVLATAENRRDSARRDTSLGCVNPRQPVLLINRLVLLRTIRIYNERPPRSLSSRLERGGAQAIHVIELP